MKIDEMIKQYRAIRDALALERKAFDIYESIAKGEMETLENMALGIANETGVDSFKTEHGTMFKTLSTYARLGAGEESKELRNAYIMRTGDFGMITSHVAKAHVQELIAEGIDPASFGVEYVQQFKMVFRR